MTQQTTIANLLAYSPAGATDQAFAEGYYAPGDLGGGEFYYESGSSAT